jgi:hypothetical protein
VNAVNLIPKERRGPHGRSSVSAPTLGLIGALALVLLAAVFYVSASNKVSVRRQQLAGVSAGVAGWTAAANSYQSYVTAAAQRASELGDVKVLAASRYPWATVLAQVGGLMPRDAALISLSATTPTPAAAAAGSTTAGSTAASPTTAATSGIQLSGCAATQSAVADTMVQLHRITGVANVTLSSTNESPTASGSSGSSAGGSCPFPVTFQIALEFANSAATTAAATSSTAGSSTTTTTTPATTGVAQ